jgi:hypothetical protein
MRRHHLCAGRRKGNEDASDARLQPVKDFWTRMMHG